MYNKNINFLFAIFFIFTIVFTTQFCYAATPDGTSQGGSTGVVSLPNPLTGTSASDSIPTFLGKIINYAMGIVGSLALVMIIYGGITWMLSGGSQEKVSQGKNIIIWAALGIAVIFASYALVRFVISAIGGAT